MLGIALLAHVQHLTGSFALAGAAMAAYATGLGLGGPLLGSLVDRHGQTAVLLLSGGASAALLGAIAALPNGVSIVVTVALAGVLGVASPPLDACVQTLLPGIAADAADVGAIFAFEESATELTWVAGPPLALGIDALWGTRASLAVSAVILATATAAFAAQPDSRRWRPARPHIRGGAFRSPAIRTVGLVLVAVGVLLGSAQVAIIASAAGLGGTGAASPLLALWGFGSLAGGLLATRLGGGATTATGLARLLAALAVGHLALAPATGSVIALGAGLMVAGGTIAPTFATIFAMVSRVAPHGSATAAFAWLATALALGEAAGAAGGGLLVSHVGTTAALALAGSAGLIATLATALRADTLDDDAVRLAVMAQGRP